jgi:hypothetical protein
MENEIWRDIIGLKGLYQVSNIGRVKSIGRNVNLSSGKVRKLKDRILHGTNSLGYRSVVLKVGTRSQTFKVHRLVAEAFIPNPEKKLCINHINGVKDDNRIENLEWCTPSENIKHAYEKLGKTRTMTGKLGANHPNAKRIMVLNKNTGEKVGEYLSGRDCAREMGLNYTVMNNALRGKRKSYRGYIFKYLSDGGRENTPTE